MFEEEISRSTTIIRNTKLPSQDAKDNNATERKKKNKAV